MPCAETNKASTNPPGDDRSLGVSASPRASVHDLAGQIVRKAWRGLARAVRRASRLEVESGAERFTPEVVHQLRVACRRTQAAMRLAEALTGLRSPSTARRTVRSLRQAAGPLRNADVHQGLLTWLRRLDTSQRQHEAIDAMLAHIAGERSIAESALMGALESTSPAACRRLGVEVGKLYEGENMDDGPPGLDAAVQQAIGPLVSQLVHKAAADLREPEHAHALRLTIKPLRYAIEQLAPSGITPLPAEMTDLLTRAQQCLGESNDIASLLERTIDTPGAGELRERFRRVMVHRTEKFAQWWALSRVRERLILTQPSALLPDAAEVHPQQQSEEATMAKPPRTPTLRDVVVARPAQAQLFLAGTRLGVIDIGSNSIRLLLVELIDDRHWTVLTEERAMTRLAQGIDNTGKITSDAMARSVEAIARFKAHCDRQQAQCRAFATAAVRDAANRRDFLSLVKDRAGLSIEIISELDEGKLTYRSVMRAHDLSQGLANVVDIGGGSLEVVTSVDGVLTSVTSMPLGAVRLTEHFGGSEAVAGAGYRALKQHCDEAIARKVPRAEALPTIVVGCGGTFNTLLTLAAASRGVMIDRGSPAIRELGPIPREQLKQLIKRLRGMTLAERLRVPGLPSDRADIVIAGLCVIERLMRHLRIDRIHGYPGGVREGLLLRWIDEVRQAGTHTTPSPKHVLNEIRAFAAQCRYERQHSEHVAHLAVQLFDQFQRESDMIPRLGEEPAERVLLEGAAVLHDIGLLVSYESHHKHSARMIQLADFAMLTPRQKLLVAMIARYHRRTPPKAKHRAFDALPAKDQQIVRRLAAILRVADGLDRTHAGVVHAVTVRFSRECVRLVIDAQSEPGEELRAAKQKSDLLADVLGVAVRFEHAGDASRAS